MARIRGRDVAAVSSQMGEDAQPAAWNTYIQVDSADDDRREGQGGGRQRDGGAVRRLRLRPHGRRSPTRRAPRSALWQPNQHLGARVVNEHGAINFNDLHTDDIEGAKAFYGAVFGWGTLDMGGGNCTWTLPAYGDLLEELNPGQRERMKRDGRARRLHRRRREPRAGAGRRAAELGRDVRGRRRRRDRREGARARRRGPGRPVRRAVGAASRSSATRRARRSPPASSCPRTRTSSRPRPTPPPRASSARARQHRSAARPPCRAAGRGRCRAGRSSRSW